MNVQGKPCTSAPTRGVYGVGFTTLVVAAALVGAMLALKRHDLGQESRERQRTLAAGPLVKVETVGLSAPRQTLVLQGEALPVVSTTLYAKLSGFLRTINVDRGDRVRAGQTLAIIESPETDRDYQSLQAVAETKQMNARRAEALGRQALLAPRDVEQAQADARMAEAKLASQGVQRGYEVLKAPFDGTVTARFADPGALVTNAASNQTSSLPVVTVARLDRLKVTLYLDQRYAGLLRLGNHIRVSPPSRPGEWLDARITRVNGALDLHTRMLLAEAEVDNRDGRIVPGSFVQTELALDTAQHLEISTEALIVRGDRTFVAVMDAGHRVAFRPVTVGEEDHQKLPVRSGLKAGELVILSLGDAAQEGGLVRPKA
jgi:membrane fusion protein, multidrug efflux system